MGQAVFNVIKRIRDGISRVFVGNELGGTGITSHVTGRRTRITPRPNRFGKDDPS